MCTYVGTRPSYTMTCVHGSGTETVLTSEEDRAECQRMGFSLGLSPPTIYLRVCQEVIKLQKIKNCATF